MDKMIRKRMCEIDHVKDTITHILTGKRLTEQDPPINLEIGDIVPIKIIKTPGVRDYKSENEILPIFTDDEIFVKVTNMYEKLFDDLDETDLIGTSPLIQNKETLCLYLALIYNLTIDEVNSDYVTIVNTVNI